MYARVATFEDVDAQRTEQLPQAASDRLRSILQGMPGWQGLLRFIDHETRTLMLVHLFDTEENARAAEATFEDMPNQVPEVRDTAGRRSSVRYFNMSFGVIRGQEL
jgi:hypothetical protein